ncbi:hypothetical protein ACROYT_G005483 [Oculina patagonica]
METEVARSNEQNSKRGPTKKTKNLDISKKQRKARRKRKQQCVGEEMPLLSRRRIVSQRSKKSAPNVTLERKQGKEPTTKPDKQLTERCNSRKSLQFYVESAIGEIEYTAEGEKATKDQGQDHRSIIWTSQPQGSPMIPNPRADLR